MLKLAAAIELGNVRLPVTGAVLQSSLDGRYYAVGSLVRHLFSNEIAFVCVVHMCIEYHLYRIPFIEYHLHMCV